ncbi:dehydrogenase [Rhizobium sp. Root1203]|nr:hypothetical protein [Rhizobium sp. Root1203]KQV30445.1 dehydrogenase [Rhizobium sp. Root1203]
MTAAEKVPDTQYDAVEQAIAWHPGDMRATISTLIEDFRHLRDQLDTVQKCMSRGLTRGWVPSPER